MRDEYDRSSKWLLSKHGKAILHLAGFTGLAECQLLASELVAPKRIPDGLLEAKRAGESVATLFLVEIATYADERVHDQMAADMMLVYLDRQALPEVITLVLAPHGRQQVVGQKSLASASGRTRWEAQWHVVELWNLKATDLLAAGDVGLVPWAAVAAFDGSPLELLTRCREMIERQASEVERENLLVVTHVFGSLRYNDVELKVLLGGRSMDLLDFPAVQRVVQREVAETLRESVLTVLVSRLGPPPHDVTSQLHALEDTGRLKQMLDEAVRTPGYDEFRVALSQR